MTGIQVLFQVVVCFIDSQPSEFKEVEGKTTYNLGSSVPIIEYEENGETKQWYLHPSQLKAIRDETGVWNYSSLKTK